MPDASGRRITTVYACRPETAGDGFARSRQKRDNSRSRWPIRRDENHKSELTVAVPPHLKVIFNGDVSLGGRPVTLADLQADDRAVVRHIGAGTGQEATALSVERVVAIEGIMRDIAVDDATKQAKVALEVGARQADNGRRPAVCRLLRDRHQQSRFDHGAAIAAGGSVAGRSSDRAARHPHRPPRRACILHDRGTVDKVQGNTLDARRQGERQPTSYNVEANCAVTVNGEPAELGDVHGGDAVEITHRSLDGRNPAADAVAVRRPIDRGRWAILVALRTTTTDRSAPWNSRRPTPGCSAIRWSDATRWPTIRCCC